jgi:hypothetical protein
VAAEQTILFTAMPRGVSGEGDTLAVSVFVAPRLRGEDRLAAYRDWLLWPRLIQENGLALELRCGGGTTTVEADPGPLRPDIWEALFDSDTFVRSHEFDDYSGRGTLSYSVREALGTLKSVYQEASVELALPDPRGMPGERGNRATLRRLVSGFEVNWNGDKGEAWRNRSCEKWGVRPTGRNN